MQFSHLPRGLRTFISASWDQSHCLTLSSSSSSLLPRCLDTFILHLTHIENTKEWFKDLPSSLRTLELRIVTGISNSFDIANLASTCPNLSKLRLGLATEFGEGEMRPLLRLLPRKLMFLHLTFKVDDPPDTGLLNQDMSLLPRGLVQLELPPSAKVGYGCEDALPLHLQGVKLGDRVGNRLPTSWVETVAKRKKR
jgi:hypothetical protein